MLPGDPGPGPEVARLGRGRVRGGGARGRQGVLLPQRGRAVGAGIIVPFAGCFYNRASNEHSRRFHNHAEVKRPLLALSNLRIY